MAACFIFLGGSFSVASELDETSRAEIIERIRPVGSVCIEGVECDAHLGAAPVVVSGSSEPRSGEGIYTKHCHTCHAIGLLNAPKKGETEKWKIRFAAAGSYDTLLQHAIHGIRNMPAKGTCMDCSDDEISNAIQYMSDIKP